MTVVQLDRYTVAMAGAAAAARRNTHLIVARHRGTGETMSWHARPRREAVEYRDLRRVTLGAGWTVKVVAVRRWWR